MTTDEIVEKLLEGYELAYAPVSGGQCLYRGHGDPRFNLSFTDFDAARHDARVCMTGSMRQGHHIFHGRVDLYGVRQ